MNSSFMPRSLFYIVLTTLLEWIGQKKEVDKVHLEIASIPKKVKEKVIDAARVADNLNEEAKNKIIMAIHFKMP